MELGLNNQIDQNFYHLMNLFASEKAHKEEQENEIAQIAIDAYEMYKRDKKEILKYKAIERDRMTIQTRIEDGYDNGKSDGIEIGKTEAMKLSAKTVIQNKYNENNLEWVDECTLKQLEMILQLVFQYEVYEDFRNKILE